NVNTALLTSFGRFWDDADPLIEVPSWHDDLAAALAALRQTPPRALLVTGEERIGKTAFLRLIARDLSDDGWMVFEAGAAGPLAGPPRGGPPPGRHPPAHRGGPPPSGDGGAHPAKKPHLVPPRPPAVPAQGHAPGPEPLVPRSDPARRHRRPADSVERSHAGRCRAPDAAAPDLAGPVRGDRAR